MTVQILNNRCVPTEAGWIDAPAKFATHGKIVNSTGKPIQDTNQKTCTQYELLSIKQYHFTDSERAGRALLGLLLAVLSVGLACLAKDVRNYFTKEKLNKRYIIPLIINENGTQPTKEESKQIHKLPEYPLKKENKNETALILTTSSHEPAHPSNNQNAEVLNRDCHLESFSSTERDSSTSMSAANITTGVAKTMTTVAENETLKEEEKEETVIPAVLINNQNTEDTEMLNRDVVLDSPPSSSKGKNSLASMGAAAKISAGVTKTIATVAENETLKEEEKEETVIPAVLINNQNTEDTEMLNRDVVLDSPPSSSKGKNSLASMGAAAKISAGVAKTMANVAENETLNDVGNLLGGTGHVLGSAGALINLTQPVESNESSWQDGLTHKAKSAVTLTKAAAYFTGIDELQAGADILDAAQNVTTLATSQATEGTNIPLSRRVGQVANTAGAIFGAASFFTGMPELKLAGLGLKVVGSTLPFIPNLANKTSALVESYFSPEQEEEETADVDSLYLDSI